MYRWIMYVSQNIPGNQSFDLERVSSIDKARDVFTKFCDDVGYDDCSARLYAYSDERWTEAEEFHGVGCPFDYPDRIVERGPSNGVIVSKA